MTLITYIHIQHNVTNLKQQLRYLYTTVNNILFKLKQSLTNKTFSWYKPFKKTLIMSNYLLNTKLYQAQTKPSIINVQISVSKRTIEKSWSPSRLTRSSKRIQPGIQQISSGVVRTNQQAIHYFPVDPTYCVDFLPVDPTYCVDCFPVEP